MKDLINFISNRVSYHVHELRDPAPNKDQLKHILKAAMSSPDHGNLTPWHFIIIDKEHIPLFIDYLQKAWLSSNQQVDPQRAKRLSTYLMQAPCIILVSCASNEAHSVTTRDQLFSAVAACQNILLASDAAGFGGIWYSTDAVELPNVRHILGLKENHIPVGFLVLGTPINKRPKKRRDPEQFTYDWRGENQLLPWSATEPHK
ncbi:nitroreductase family protein [Alteromonas sp. a30]|uniref:nitroreductase family protein n=1 Tax=Alteromonas sp. a30 TaxID=2730917 RepID=UPI002282E3E7|nr:nitroreductase [Alteromonas sp. a30]MCY7295179.1 nitroreductase [Alteromonas sp. a30]